MTDRATALAWLRRQLDDDSADFRPGPLQPRKQVRNGLLPGYGLSGNLAGALDAGIGRVLSRWGDAGWGEVVARDKGDRRFRDDLVVAVAQMVQDRWRPAPPPQWITCVPSLEHPTLVPDFAERLAAALAWPFTPVVVKVRRNAQQKQQQNTAHQCRNLDGVFEVRGDLPDGPVLLKNARPLSNGEWARFAIWLKDNELAPDSLLRGGWRDVVAGWTDPAVPLVSLEALLNRGAALGFAMERWQRAGVWVLTRADAEYPVRFKKRLRARAPAVLFGCGNRRLLNAGGVAVVGSREAGDDDLRFARELGEQAARQEGTVVSGGARGIDQAAMLGALESDGTVVGVLADSLLRSATSTRCSGNAELVKRGARWLPPHLGSHLVVALSAASAPERCSGSPSAGAGHRADREPEVALATPGTTSGAGDAPDGCLGRPDFYRLFLDWMDAATASEPIAAEAIAERLALKKTQIAAWLSRGIAEERVRKLTRPVRYAVTHRPDPQASFLRDRE